MVKLIKLGNDRKPILIDGKQVTQEFPNAQADKLLKVKYPYWAATKDSEGPKESRETAPPVETKKPA